MYSINIYLIMYLFILILVINSSLEFFFLNLLPKSIVI